MASLLVVAQRSIIKAKWRLFYADLSKMYAKFKAGHSENELKELVCQLATDQGYGYQLDLLKDELSSLTAWQHLLLFMSKGLFGREFSREEIASLTGARLSDIHATCGSVKLIRAGGVLD